MELSTEDKIKAGILGATGMVGQRFIQLLQDHPWFRVSAVAASERSSGNKYGEVVDWMVSEEVPEEVEDLIVQQTEPPLDCDIIFSSLPGNIAGPVEERFASSGYPLFTNAKSHRMDQRTPLVIPEVNPDHLDLISFQKNARGWSEGFIVANPNCSAVGLTMALAPLHKEFGLEKVAVTTLQAVSGAGYPGESSFDMLGNVVPHIGGEEDKLLTEPKKMLGNLNTDSQSIVDADIDLSATCTRVPVVDGHVETVLVSLSETVSIDDVVEAFSGFQPEWADRNLPHAPDRPLVYLDGEDRPQPRLDINRGNGMSTSLGRLTRDQVFDFRFVLLSHNTIRGAAGGSVLNAELAKSRDLI